MKKIIFALCSIVFIASCKEQIPAGLNTASTILSTLDTTYVKDTAIVAQTKQILLEELTGVSCQPCGSFGTQLINNINTTYPNKVIAARIYCGLNNKVNPNDSTLGNDPLLNNDLDSKQLENFLVNVGQPCASVDRYNNGSLTAGVYCYGRNSWLGVVNNLVNNTTPVNIYLNSIFDNINNKIQLNTAFVFTDSTSQKLAYNIYLLENNIIAGQDTIGGKVDSFLHNEVLRKCLTPAVVGTSFLDSLTTIEKHRIVLKNLSFTLPNNVINYHNCKIVVFISNRDTKQVVQVQEVNL